jgi:cobaltochelatase CobN
VWKKMFDVYVADEYKLDMEKFFDKANAAARQNIVARLLEVDRQGTYKFSDEDRQTLVTEYVRLVSKHGVACSANVCGNRKLQLSVLDAARQISPEKLAKAATAAFEKEFREAMQQQPSKNSLSRAKPGAPSLPDLFDKVRIVSMTEFAERTRRYIEENIWLLGAIWLASLALGGVFARLRRHRADWVTVALLQPRKDS